MRTNSIFLLTLSLALTFSTTFSQAQAIEATRKGPAVHLADSTQNFGKILVGDVVKHSFVITNVGTETIQITKIDHSCGCTSAGYDKIILPGKTGQVSFAFNTQGLDGKFHKTATIHTNNPKNPTVTVDLLGEVWSELKIEPSFAVFQPSKNTLDTRVIRIVSQVEKPLTLASLACAYSRFKTSIREIENGKIYELTISTDPSQFEELAQAAVSFNTSCERTPTVTIPVLVIAK